MFRGFRFFCRIKPLGLILLSMGIGMLLVIIIPTWALLVSAILIALGSWILFF